jgi:hypothetical protein
LYALPDSGVARADGHTMIGAVVTH